VACKRPHAGVSKRCDASSYLGFFPLRKMGTHNRHVSDAFVKGSVIAIVTVLCTQAGNSFEICLRCVEVMRCLDRFGLIDWFHSEVY
jgi:hypothetical protein